MSYAGTGTHTSDLPQRVPGATFHKPAATTLRPVDPAQARRVLEALAADRDDDTTAHRTLGGMDAWGRPHAHDAF